MARIKVELPPFFSFSTRIPIRITDVNYGGHAGNDALLGIIHEARLQFLQDRGYSEMNIEGVGLIMADVAIEFKAEAFYKDIIQVSIGAHDFSRVGFDLVYKLEKTQEEKSVTVAIAKTGMVCFDYVSKRVAALPESVSLKLSCPH
ncbi:thioesterase family protein [Niabella yanshanensis]|uniref:Thioesterase family protein n=1 Tax=Niabella yanshanensis TaxID=577386 RepID=A0ABZ0W5E9_9BACT|nr:thioesterase family protein [Niabella yanshanensis]WQD37924.1 thioesterase family protein [Niabella yanshanensis]